MGTEMSDDVHFERAKSCPCGRQLEVPSKINVTPYVPSTCTTTDCLPDQTSTNPSNEDVPVL